MEGTGIRVPACNTVLPYMGANIFEFHAALFNVYKRSTRFDQQPSPLPWTDFYTKL